MKHWFKEKHFRSLLKNSSYLVASKAVAAVAALATLAFAGRSLGLVMFGMLILIVSYAKAASGISKFQSWQLIVRYGGRVLSGDQTEKFKAATGFAFALDVVSGLAGMVLAIALLPLIGGWFGIEDHYLVPAMIYCTLLPTMGAATPAGVLRSLDRFDLISWQGTTYPIARAVLAGAAWMADAPFEAFVAIWYVTDLGGDIYVWFLAWRELRRHDLLDGIRPTFRPTELPGAWRFAIHVNLTSSLSAAWGPVARLLVGGLVGPAGAAIYRVAGSLSDAAQKPADLFSKAYYPEIVRMDLTTKKPWKLMLRVAAIAVTAGGTAALVLVLGGEWLVGTIFGKDFLPAYPVLMILILAPLLGMISFPLPAMLYALDRPEGPLRARLLAVACYCAIVAPLAYRFGVQGAAAAFVVAYGVMVLALIVQVWREYRRVRSPASA
jgi:O-antigen/teichoic acid export membrane protein